MGKTTNILDLNNRLTKVEKENVAQNSYTSLKNKPKINNVTLTGNKTSSDLGLAAAGDITDINTNIGDMSELETTATNLVGAINELDALSKRVYGTPVEISSYDDATNYYTVPCDGMVMIAINGTITSAKASVIDLDLNADLGDSIGNGSTQIRNGVSVLKNQKIYILKMGAPSTTAIFYPKVNPS